MFIFIALGHQQYPSSKYFQAVNFFVNIPMVRVFLLIYYLMLAVSYIGNIQRETDCNSLERLDQLWVETHTIETGGYSSKLIYFC